MRTIAQLIKLGLEHFTSNGGFPYMCYAMADLFERQQVTLEEYVLFKEWLHEEILRGVNSSVLGKLDRVGLDTTKENWVQFYVWAYYDLIKRNHHEHQP
ncbi:hypothetical protein ACQ34_gp08 [Pseudomonas phage YH6]|uniref:Uncharacterized protein n=1 Tax=Pseudomonas phage YH6 TaxID=1566995 RepID=A0A0A0YVQ0_9CAUD|nr:hypothetical protein ACQ34_gp08 [Pseudomonas phage YH6]AIX13161.1 hypothetical protein YH6_008 [Pseudomonas phage YH6]